MQTEGWHRRPPSFRGHPCGAPSSREPSCLLCGEAGALGPGPPLGPGPRDPLPCRCPLSRPHGRHRARACACVCLRVRGFQVSLPNAARCLGGLVLHLSPYTLLFLLFSEIVMIQLQAGNQRRSLPGLGCRHGGDKWGPTGSAQMGSSAQPSASAGGPCGGRHGVPLPYSKGQTVQGGLFIVFTCTQAAHRPPWRRPPRALCPQTGWRVPWLSGVPGPGCVSLPLGPRQHLPEAGTGVAGAAVGPALGTEWG